MNIVGFLFCSNFRSVINSSSSRAINFNNNNNIDCRAFSNDGQFLWKKKNDT